MEKERVRGRGRGRVGGRGGVRGGSGWRRRGRDRDVCSFILHNIIIHNIILDHESSGRVTHDSHMLQTKAINHLIRRYMNRGELEWDQPIHVPLLRVLAVTVLQCSPTW